MRAYKNESGNSGVKAFEIIPDGIRVLFVDDIVYEYTVDSAGKKNISQMEKLALGGKGLSTFISQVVKNRYSRRGGDQD